MTVMKAKEAQKTN